jgi:outer membrane protein
LIVKRNFIVLLAAAALTGFAPLASADTKIGVVDVNRLAQQAPQARDLMDKLKAEFTMRKQDIDKKATQLQQRQDKLSKDAATMTELQKSAAEKELRDGNRDLSALKAAFDDDLNARQQEVQVKVTSMLDEEVSTYAKAQGYDLILADGVIFASAAVDLTPAILQAMLARKPAGAAPAAAPAAGKPPAPAKP